MKVIIPSKGRSDIIGDRTLRLFPDATVCVGDDEVDDYSKVTQRLLVHPANVMGTGPLRNWIMDNVDDPCVVMVDDDMKRMYSQVGFHKRAIEDPATIQAIVERLAIVAADAGIRVFGFNQCSTPMSYSNCKPFSVNTWVSGLVGIIGRELRYDESLLLRADIDFCLQSFIRDRIVLCDGRYVCQFGLFAGKGGNSILRSKERHERETAYLKRKWGKYLDVVNAKDTTRIVLHVERTGRGSAKR